jgi:hypothetical protein
LRRTTRRRSIAEAGDRQPKPQLPFNLHSRFS